MGKRHQTVRTSKRASGREARDFEKKLNNGTLVTYSACELITAGFPASIYSHVILIYQNMHFLFIFFYIQTT